MKLLTISARTLGELGLADFCARCFWITMNCENKLPFQIPMPGIFNSIDAYGKKLIHRFFDQNNVLPPWFPNIGKVRSYVPSRDLHWSRFKLEEPNTRITIRGTPDDVFCLSDRSYHIVDYKTAKATPTQDELFPSYEVQLNVYAFIAQSQGLSPISDLSLIYMEPQTDLEPSDLQELMSDDAYSLEFAATLVPVELCAGKLVPELLQQARKILDSPRPPEGRDGCEDCGLLHRLMTIAQA